VRSKLLLTVVAAFVLFILITPSAMAGKHNGEVKYLSYEVVYTNPAYVDNGVPVYYIGDTMTFEVHLTNTGPRSFQNIEVIAIQEYSNGDVLPGSSTTSWIVEEIRGQGTVALDGSYLIPWSAQPGFDRTHLIIRHKDKGKIEGEIIIDDPLAGSWCP